MAPIARTSIRLHSSDAAEATREAAGLRRALLDGAPPGVAVDLVKENANSQDMGATLLVALSAPAVVAVAHGIADWIRKRRIGSSIELEIAGSRIKLDGEIADRPERLESLVLALSKAVRGP